MLAKIKVRCLNNLKTAKLELAQAMDGEEWFKVVLVELDDVIYQVANLTVELKCADCGLMIETKNNMPPEGWEFVDETEEGGTTCWLCGQCANKERRLYAEEGKMARCNEAITISDEWVLLGHEPMESIIRCELEQGHQGDHQYQGLRWHLGNAGAMVLSAERPDLLTHAGQKIRRKDLSFEGEGV